MTTTYGTIPTASSSPSDPSFISDVRHWIRSGVGIRRPWKELMTSSFSFPESFNTAFHRVGTNASYFHVNYTIIVLFTLFCSLLWHPVSLIVFLLAMAAWLFLYFLRDQPVVVCGYGVEERLVLVALSVFTVVLLLMTRAVVFVDGLAVGLVLVTAHATFMRTADSFFDDMEGGSERVVGLKDTASASYSTSDLEGLN